MRSHCVKRVQSQFWKDWHCMQFPLGDTHKSRLLLIWIAFLWWKYTFWLSVLRNWEPKNICGNDICYSIDSTLQNRSIYQIQGKLREKKSFTLLQSKMYYLQYFLYENWFCVNIKWNGLVYILKLLLPSIQIIVRLCLSTRRIVVQKMCTTHAMNQQIFSMHCEYATTTEMIFSLIP